MANSLAIGGTLRHLRDLFRDGTAVGLGDGQLLARYAASHDGPAFEALVARHGPMVLATCRAVLKHEQDVEDAFQATFLVLARKAPFGPRRRRPGRLAAPRGLSRGGAGEHRVAAEAPPRGGGIGDDDHDHDPHRARSRHPAHRARGGRPAAGEPPAAGGALRPGGPDLRAGRRPAAMDRADPAVPAGRARQRLHGPAGPPGDHGGAVGVVLAASRPGRAAVPAVVARSAVAAATGGMVSSTAAAL